MKFIHYLSVASLFVTLLGSCTKSSSIEPITPINPITSTVDIRGSISSNQTWTKDKVYRLRGYVYVESGTTLQIEAGTKIVSNKDSAGVLIVYKGAKIIANGSASSPIVFTSAEANPAPGDVGGVVLVGNATTNGNHGSLEGGVDATHSSFGGSDDSDNSGTLSYVRIEYAGKAVNPGDEVNGLSLYAVGRGTNIDHIQVVRGLDDAFEFFGGAVNCKYLIAYNCADDDYDFDDGYHGKIQFAVSIKDPKFTDAKSGGDLSNNLEVDNTNGKIPYSTTPITHPILSNFTVIGANNAVGTSSDMGYSARFRRGSQVVLANSILLGGQKAGLVIENAETQIAYQNGNSMLYNSMLNSAANPFFAKDGSTLFSGQTNIDSLTNTTLQQLTTGTYITELLSSSNDAGLIKPFDNVVPNLLPSADSKAKATAGKFDKSDLVDAFFTHTQFIGAFDIEGDWTSGWAVWGK